MHLFLLSIWYSIGIIKNNYSSKDILSKFLEGITKPNYKLGISSLAEEHVVGKCPLLFICTTQSLYVLVTY